MATPLLQDYPELSHLSREDLEDLLNDPAYFQAVFHSLDRVKDLYRAQAELGLANETIARNNLAHQESLYKLRAETQAAFDEAKALEKRWKELEKEQKEVYQRFTPQFLLMRLKHATTDQDDATEAMANSFVQQQPTFSNSLGEGSGTSTPRNNTDVDDFIRQFKEARKIYHKRAMWADKWTKGEVIWREE
ncbi:hypothetical protein NMY22_g152 [Coprinellus aureogranulatus]|nr:hypothetical protein NMY22_g152 [Coprinellus aureogranulatus]